jgi:hypothetical protein
MRIQVPDHIWPRLLTISDYSNFELVLDRLAKEVEESLIQDYGKVLPYSILVSKQDLILGIILSYFQFFGHRGREKERIPFDFAYRYLDQNWKQFLPSNVVHAFTIDEKNYVFSFQRISEALDYNQFRRLVLISAEVFSVDPKEMCWSLINKSESYRSLDNVRLKEFAGWFLSEAENVVLEIDNPI